MAVKGIASFNKYDKKAERTSFAQVEYKKILDEIRFILRGEPFDEKTLLDKLKVVDDFVSDHCMEIPASIQQKYRESSSQTSDFFEPPP